MLIRSEKYPQLLVVGVVKFRDGEAEVDDPALIERLRKFDVLGVVVPDATEPPPTNPAPPAGELPEPKGNASLEEWSAYAIQKGVNAESLEGLKREEVKALLSE